jgi:Lrp/AsnC family transcriptional regulator, regulator for asnA, asnC and gidA
MDYAMRNDDQRLDEVDRELVRQLQQDGRRSYREMARSLAVSEGTVRWRVKRLQDTGALRIAAIADPFRLGYTVLASMFLRVSSGELERVIDTLVGWQEVVYVSSCTGRVDVYIQVVCRSHEDLWELVAQRIPGIGGVLETETLMELKVHKLQYVYPGLDHEL